MPMTGGDGVVAVLELFVTHERAGEPGRLERIARVAEELGPLVERRRAAETLAASQEQFAAVTDAAVDPIVSADSSGRVLTWNRGAERLFGWTADEKELERANAELETLAYSASHDLKSPMVSLLGYLEYLRLDYGEVLGPEGNRYLNRMADSTVHMQQLIHDLIDLSRVGRSGVEPIEVDLGRLVRPSPRTPARPTRRPRSGSGGCRW